MVSLVWWILDRAAWQGPNSTQSSERMTGSGPDRPSRPGNPFVALLLLEKAQRAATAHWGGWSPVSLPELQSSCPAPRYGAAAPTPDHTSCSESRKTHGGWFTHLTSQHVVVHLNRHRGKGSGEPLFSKYAILFPYRFWMRKVRMLHTGRSCRLNKQ